MKTKKMIKTTLAPLFAAILVPSPAAQAEMKSAGALEFGADNVLFVGDSKAAAVHAFALRESDFTSQAKVEYGNAKSFEGRDLITNIDQKLAALLGVKVGEAAVNDLVVHKGSKQIFLSVSRGLGPKATPVIVKVNDGALELLDLAEVPHSQLAIENAPTDGKLEFGQLQRALTITDIAWWKGEIFVAGVSNEEFASKVRRAKYPFEGKFAETSVEIWHAVHAQFETRAPIINHMVQTLDGTDYLIATYVCTPLVRIPLEEIKPGAKIRGAMIGELGFGNTPIDMVTYHDRKAKQDFLLVTNNSRSATRVPLARIATAKPMPVEVPMNFGPAGIEQYSIPVTGAHHMGIIDKEWAVVIRRRVNKPTELSLTTLPLPFFFDRADHIVEFNWPGAYNRHKENKKK